MAARARPLGARAAPRAARGRRRRAACASAAPSAAERVAGAMLGFPPLWRLAREKAKQSIKARLTELGRDWDAELQATRDAADWDEALREATDPDVALPEYYTASFHSYPLGNLEWDAAHEAPLAAVAVHAPVFNGEAGDKRLDAQGDARLRASYHEALAALLPEGADGDLKRVVDLGSSVGLSTAALARAFPLCKELIGAELSPYMLAVARQRLQAGVDSDAFAGRAVTYAHAAAEDLRQLEDGSVDLVSACLLFHELPADVAARVIQEAARVLRPGGFFAMMDMDPSTPAFRRIAENPFAYTAFKSTEPYLDQYACVKFAEVIERAGLASPQQRSNSPRHRTIVAMKTEATV